MTPVWSGWTAKMKVARTDDLAVAQEPTEGGCAGDDSDWEQMDGQDDSGRLGADGRPR